MRQPDRSGNKPGRFSIPLRAAIALPVALILIASVGFQELTQHDNSTRLIDTTSIRLLDALTVTTNNRLANFLEVPFAAQQALGDAIVRYKLYTPGNMEPVYRHIVGTFHGLYQDQAQISVMSFGSALGEFAGVRRKDNHYNLMLSDRTTQGKLLIYKDNAPGATTATFAGYDPRTRPWYAPFAKSGKAGWSDIYANYDEFAEVTISAATPVRQDGQLLGVVDADVKLSDLNRFLRDETLRGSGSVAITDGQGVLIAHSGQSPVLSDGHGGIARGERLSLAQSEDPVLRAAAAWVSKTPQDQSVSFHDTVDGRAYSGRVTPFFDKRGLHWRIVTLVPDSDLVGDIRASTRQAAILLAMLAISGLLLCLWVIGWVTRPIHRTAQAANRLAQGDWLTKINTRSPIRETSTLVKAFNTMARQVDLAFNTMRDQLRLDGLTQLLTRQGLLEEVNWPEQRPAILCLIGLDGFRTINDNLGYDTSSRLLQAVAERLRNHLPCLALLARIGGDEFAVICVDPTQSADETGAQVLALFNAPFVSGDDEIMVSASVGVVEGMLSSDVLPEWLRNASVAMGEAKRRARMSSVVFEPAMLERLRELSRLTSDLRQALEHDQFLVHYQPVISMADGQISGVEALVRWQSPTRGLVPPAMFIPIAENSDLILALGDWVLRTATRDIAALLDRLSPQFELHVNVSARQLIQSDFINTLRQALQESGLPPQFLTLELTESVLIERGGQTVERLREIRGLGVKIAIDDFGTGYSSLSYLGTLPIDCLKIDKSFVDNICESSQDTAVVAAILHMARGFGVTAVAEGVETESQAQRLREMGCSHAQGYLFGRPVPFNEVNWPNP
ncbi:bifunctional diguanylate cyclase/phosphodiesterase [Silvimonas amylolytica]|uniref:Sensor domain-containing phosphodiesterase n=1 Tax=Silvimonas amylolytica TaxID=449663 RepID=A0ABQ2PJ63_9NEIS|nr:EAL domain-containing protein [Silvimonas amylolytica]GGP25072.1 sensor domain-containing phosphodiesterase [Silvimonas amylolytica]